jgi:hypothetical protein
MTTIKRPKKNCRRSSRQNRFLRVLSRVAADPDWIRMQSGQWIWIRIWIRNPDPDPGGQK